VKTHNLHGELTITTQ